jgi:hypothetical protein
MLVVLGVITGGMASLWGSRFVATLLYGLEPHDPAMSPMRPSFWLRWVHWPRGFLRRTRRASSLRSC